MRQALLGVLCLAVGAGFHRAATTEQEAANTKREEREVGWLWDIGAAG